MCVHCVCHSLIIGYYCFYVDLTIIGVFAFTILFTSEALEVTMLIHYVRLREESDGSCFRY